MKPITPELLDRNIQQKILQELKQKTPPGVIASQLKALKNIDNDIAYSNIRFLDLKGYVTVARMHNIGSNHAFENDVIIQLTSMGRRFLDNS